MQITLSIINQAMATSKKACIAFSGGTDSMILLDIIHRHTKHRPLVIFADSQMEYPETEDFCRNIAEQYGAPFHVARADRTPEEQWKKQGWPMLGKVADRTWMRRHKGRDFGFKLDISSCCRNLKILPGRKLAKALGCDLQITGTRGSSDDRLRGMRTMKDGATHYVKVDKITICNPLTGWTDTMGRRYRDRYNLPEHPAKARGAVTIGCVACGGGSQFTISLFRLLRKTWPEAWWQYIVEIGMGEIILAIKWDAPLRQIRNIIENAGGIEKIAKERPWIFDFTSKHLLPGHDK